MQPLSLLPGRRRFRYCFTGTCMDSCFQRRWTRFSLICQPRDNSSLNIRSQPKRGRCRASRLISASNSRSCLGRNDWYRCVARGCPNTRHVRRSENRSGPKRRRTSAMVRLHRSGPYAEKRPVSLDGLLEYLHIQCLLSHQLLQSSVFFLDCLEFLCHLGCHAAILLSPAVVGLN